MSATGGQPARESSDRAAPAARDTDEAQPIAVVITCSDSAATGRAADTSGPLAAQLLGALDIEVADVRVVSDDEAAISGAVREAIADGAHIVVTTGGTGAGPRDVTPDTLHALGLRELPGLGEAIRAASRAHVPAADLSRALGGILDGAVVLALPGSPGGVRDGLAAVGGLLSHAAAVASGAGHSSHRRPAAPQPPSTSASPRPAASPPSAPSVRESVHGVVGIHDTTAEVAGESAGRAAAQSAEVAADSGLVRGVPITEAEVASTVARADAGAVVTFAGVVRDHDGGRQVTALHYEAHPDAGRALAQVVARAGERPGVLAAAALHRVGDLEIGELAFVAAVSAAHRGAAFAACAWLVDEAKARVPIWKHQLFADGSDEWVNTP